MTKYQVVIGANYGDEGKGQVTDYLVSKTTGRTAVVRFNGGAQAGHTVCTPDGKRHVFSHFGSGSFLGADTILTKDFILNPQIFINELHELVPKIDRIPMVFVHSDSPITTPYEVSINRALERKRGGDKHGSVGVGINETLIRHRSYPLSLFDNNILDAGTLKYVCEEDAKSRADFLGVKIEVTDRELENYCYCVGQMRRYVYLYEDFIKLEDHYDDVIFEGAQGLLLDQEYGQMPYCTPSNCGLKNVVDLVGQAPMDVHYVTRSYVTRHGAGPLKDEREVAPTCQDDTNVTGEWQGKLRVGSLCLNDYFDRCKKDMRYNTNATMKHVMTWVRPGFASIEKKFDLKFHGKTRDDTC